MDSSREIVKMAYVIFTISIPIHAVRNVTTTLPWKPWCTILVKSKTAKCSSHGKILTEIPSLPKFVQKLYLHRTRFLYLKSGTFEPIRKNDISLIFLSVRASQVHYVGDDAFKDVPSLKFVDLSANFNLNVSSLKKSFASLENDSITTLAFSRMRWTSEILHLQIFVSLSLKDIDLMVLAWNKFSYIPNSSLEGLHRLKRIDLSFNYFEKCEEDLLRLSNLQDINLNHNYITTCNVEYLPKTLKKLRLKNNSLREVPLFCSSTKSPLLLALETLMLDGNVITNLTKGSLECIPRLKYLGLSLNNIRHFRSQVFTHLPMLEVLKLSHMKVKVIRIDKGAFSIPTLREFYFDRNYFEFDDTNNAKQASLGNCSKLELLDLSYNYMPKWSHEMKYILNGLTNIRTIHLIQVFWNVLPSNLFKMIPNVKEVYLSLNKITQLNSSLFLKESKIERMNLDNNRIAHVGPNTFPDVFWKAIKTIDLSGNPFACDCELLWFRDLLRNSKERNITFKQYPRQYNCLFPEEKKGLNLAKFDMTSKECQKKSEFILIISTTASIVFMGLVLILVAYNGRWHIKYLIYLLRNKRRGYRRLLDDEFKFDGFIIYSEADSDFVHNTLLTKLEKENSYKMCVHYRDFEVGKFIVDNIVECMSQSRHALVVISKQFCQSKWCKFELVVAQDRWLRDEGDTLVIVMLEEVDSRDMTKDLRALIRTTTYCSWTESEVGQELFWKQLYRSITRYAE